MSKHTFYLCAYLLLFLDILRVMFVLYKCVQTEFTGQYLRKSMILNMGKQDQYEKTGNTEKLEATNVAQNFNRYTCMPL